MNLIGAMIGNAEKFNNSSSQLIILLIVLEENRCSYDAFQICKN